MTATEARRMALQVTLQVTQGRNAEQMKKVEEEIKKAVYEGELVVTVYFALLPGVIEHLEKEGYKVTPFNDPGLRSEPSTKISWEL